MNELNQSKEERVKQIFKILDADCFTPEFTVRAWANQLKMTVPYLSKLLRDHTGNPASWHLRNKRLTKASHLLAQGNSPITDIATAVGYENNNYFSRIFKQNFNISPTEWREKHIKNDNLLP
jgi:AraC-like DNA-binding protein